MKTTGLRPRRNDPLVRPRRIDPAVRPRHALILGYAGFRPEPRVRSAGAGLYTFEERPYFVSEALVNPTIPAAVDRLMERRGELLSLETD